MTKHYARDSDIIGAYKYNWLFFIFLQATLDTLHVLMPRIELEFFEYQATPDNEFPGFFFFFSF